MKRSVLVTAAVVLGLTNIPRIALAEDQPTPVQNTNCSASALHCPLTQMSKELVAVLATFPTPKLAGPAPLISEPTIKIRKPVTRTVTYDVGTRGTITASLADFKAKVAETYADSRGWTRLGVVFKEVATGGDFTVVLSEASQVPSFSPTVCSADWSCRVGRYVIINQDRWLGATTAWNNAGGDLRGYRHMVVNHETGHWLGHGHRNCGGAGQPAPVMQQQSINLQGCKFNPWPLDSEIWSSRLGI